MCMCFWLFSESSSTGDLSSLILSLWLMLCVSDKDRQTVFISLTVISLVGCFLFFLIRKPDPEPSSSEAAESLLQAEQAESTESGSRWVLPGSPVSPGKPGILFQRMSHEEVLETIVLEEAKILLKSFSVQQNDQVANFQRGQKPGVFVRVEVILQRWVNQTQLTVGD